MPDKARAKPETDTQAMRLARTDRRAGKAPSTQAGNFVEEEMLHAREGRHKVRGAQQAVAIGLAKARRHGIAVPKRKGA